MTAARQAASAVLAAYQAAVVDALPAERALWGARVADALAAVLAVPAPAEASPSLETEAQARELPAVRAVHAAFDADPGVGKMAPHNARMLDEACTAAGVELGAYDWRILAWLAGWEPQTCAVVAGLITRAHAAGAELLRGAVLASNYDLGDDEVATVLDALEVAGEYREYRAGLTCDDCDQDAAGLCESHGADLDRVNEYELLARRIRQAQS